MRNQFILIFILAICNSGCNKPQPPNETVKDASIDSTSLFISEKEFHIQPNSAPKSNDSILILTLHDTLIFTSHPDLEEKSVRFEYFNQNPINDYHILKATYWEWSETYLINHHTSAIDTIWELPIFSENGKLILSKSMDYGLEGNPNGFQLWKLREQRWTKIYEIDQQDWIPVSLKWISNEQYIVLTTTQDQLESVNFNYNKLTKFDTIQYSIDSAVPYPGGK